MSGVQAGASRHILRLLPRPRPRCHLPIRLTAARLRTLHALHAPGHHLLPPRTLRAALGRPTRRVHRLLLQKAQKRTAPSHSQSRNQSQGQSLL